MLTSAQLHQWSPAARFSPQPPGRGLFEQAKRRVSIIKLERRAAAEPGVTKVS
jgi:hypothetical protein